MEKFNKEIESLLSGLSKNLTKEDIANKHSKKLKKPLKEVKKILNSELKKGEKVEKEHTPSKTIAKKIALDHEVEKLKYYTNLKKAEKLK